MCTWKKRQKWGAVCKISKRVGAGYGPSNNWALHWSEAKDWNRTLQSFALNVQSGAHHYTRCTTNVHQCAPTVGIINSHDDRVHSNLGQMPRSNLLRMIPKKRMSIESFWVLNCKLLRLLLKSCGAAIPYQLCSSTLTIGRLRYNKPQPSVTPAIPAANLCNVSPSLVPWM